MLFAAVHESAYGTERTGRDVCFSIAIGDKRTSAAALKSSIYEYAPPLNRLHQLQAR